MCNVAGCDRPLFCRGICKRHYMRMWRLGTTEISIREWGTGNISRGYKLIQQDNVGFREHVRIAETTLGKKLPRGAVIHHVDGNGLNNDYSNLVVCPNEAYHKLLHQRQRALDASGNANWLVCVFCGIYDNPLSMHVQPNKPSRAYHRPCAARYARERRMR